MNKQFAYKFALALLVLAVLSAFPIPFLSEAMASPLEGGLCEILSWIQGPTGAAIATGGVIIVGFVALTGRLNFGVVIITACGVILIFVAPDVVAALGGPDGGCIGDEITPGDPITPGI